MAYIPTTTLTTSRVSTGTTGLESKVAKASKDVFKASINTVVIEDEVEVFNQTFSKNFTLDMDFDKDIKPVLYKKMQVAWDKYKADQLVFASEALVTLNSDLQKDFNTYINPIVTKG